MEHLVTGEVEEFLFDGIHWSRKIQISELSRGGKRENGVELRPSGTVKLLHNGSTVRLGDEVTVQDAKRQRRFVLTSSSPPVFRIVHDQGPYWEYIYVNKRWHRVFADTPARGREFLPGSTKKGGDDGILTPVPVAMPKSGILQVGPLTLYANGSLEFGDTLYRARNAIANHEHLGFVVKRHSGRRQMTTIKRVGRTATDDELPLMLRFEWGVWFRYVRRRATFRARFAHYFREATLPLKRVMEWVGMVLVHVCLWSLVTGHVLFWIVLIAICLEAIFW